MTPDGHKWMQLFNRLEKAVSRHYDDKHLLGTDWSDDADDALHHAWRKILESASVANAKEGR